MKRIVKRTTTTEEWVDPGDEDQEPRGAAEDDDVDDPEDESDDGEPENEPKQSRRRR